MDPGQKLGPECGMDGPVPCDPRGLRQRRHPKPQPEMAFAGHGGGRMAGVTRAFVDDFQMARFERRKPRPDLVSHR